MYKALLSLFLKLLIRLSSKLFNYALLKLLNYSLFKPSFKLSFKPSFKLSLRPTLKVCSKLSKIFYALEPLLNAFEHKVMDRRTKASEPEEGRGHVPFRGNRQLKEA